MVTSEFGNERNWYDGFRDQCGRDRGISMRRNLRAYIGFRLAVGLIDFCSYQEFCRKISHSDVIDEEA